MRNRLVLALIFLVGTPLVAQEEEKLTFDELRSNLREADQQTEKESEEKRSEKIRRNHNETLAIYERVLRRRSGDLNNVATRLKVTRGLEVKYSKLLKRSGSELALLRSTWINRTLALKKSREEGRISLAAYSRLIEQDGQKYRNRETELKEDIIFYTQELKISRETMKELKVKKELLEFDPFEPENLDSSGEGEAPRIGVADRVLHRVRTVARYQDQSVVDTIR